MQKPPLLTSHSMENKRLILFFKIYSDFISPNHPDNSPIFSPLKNNSPVVSIRKNNSPIVSTIHFSDYRTIVSSIERLIFQGFSAYNSRKIQPCLYEGTYRHSTYSSSQILHFIDFVVKPLTAEPPSQRVPGRRFRELIKKA